MSVCITAIRKDNGNHYNPYEAVEAYQWFNEETRDSGFQYRPQMVAWMQNGGRAYVKSSEGAADCFVNTSAAGTKFLQTHADSKSANNLLNLPAF